MALQGWTVIPCERSYVRAFIEQWHYSHSINGLKISQCFALHDPSGVLMGAALFGECATTAWKRYGQYEGDVLELRRLCCVDDTPKNTESFLVGACLRWLKKHSSYGVVVSYADPNYGHCGTIYKASNFRHVGMTLPGIVLMWEGRKYHDRALRTRYNGEYKPFVQRLRDAYDAGLVIEVEQVGKHIYLYGLK